MIFLTGGTGFLGRHLLAVLCHRQYSVRLLTRQPDHYPWLVNYPNVEIIAGDVRDAEIVRRAVDGCQYIIHAGGYFRFWGDANQFEEINACGTENIMAAALASGVERVVYVSTVAVIGQPDAKSIVDENHPAHPADPYQHSKLHAEQTVLRYHHEHQVPGVIVRPGAYYGPLGDYAFNRLFFKDPMRGIIMQVDGGRYIIFPVYIADVADGVMRALEKGGVGEVYNLCGDWISHRDAFDIICEEANLHWPRLPIPGWLGIGTARLMEYAALVTHREPFWPINLRSYVYNNWRVSSEKARRELGFSPVTFREGARRTIAWYRNGQPEDIPEVRC